MVEINIYDREEEEYTVTIDKIVYQKMFALGKAMGENEVQGMLVVDIKDRKIIVEDILLPAEQIVTGGSADIDSKEMAKMLEPYVAKDPELFAKVKGWWHSHNSLGVFWSAVDDNNVKKIVQVAGTFVSIVTTNDGKLLTRVDKKLSDGMVITYNDVTTYADMYDDAVMKWVDKIKKTVKVAKIKWPKNAGLLDVFDDELAEEGENWPPSTQQQRPIRKPTKGYKDPQHGYIPPLFASLDGFSKTAFYSTVAKSKVSKKGRKNLVRKLLLQEQEIMQANNPLIPGVM